jgi:hypothetical protein
MAKEAGSKGEIYEGSVRDRLNSLFLASGGNVSKAVEHRYAILNILQHGTAEQLTQYFASDAFEMAPAIRQHEMRYAAMTAVFGILSNDVERKEQLLAALRTDVPSESMGSVFVSKQKYLGDNSTLAAQLADSTGVSEDVLTVLVRILEETSDASIDSRGRQKTVSRALEQTVYGGLSTMDALLSSMFSCIERDMIYIDRFFMSRTTEERQKIVHDCMTVSLHRVQAVAGMRHDLSTKLLNTDTRHAEEWVLKTRSDGQVVVTTEPLETYLSPHVSSPVYNHLVKRHREGHSHVRHTQGCPVMILPLFLEAGRAMIERYSHSVK